MLVIRDPAGDVSPRVASSHSESPIQIWQVAQVAKRLIDCDSVSLLAGQHHNWSNGQPLTNLVASLCWIFQKAALLEGILASIARCSGECGASTSTVDKDLPDFGVSLTACNSDLALAEEMSLPVESSLTEELETVNVGRVVEDVQYWLCDSCTEYTRSDKRLISSHVTTFHHAVQSLRCALFSSFQYVCVC